jgi:hypothetical protein
MGKYVFLGLLIIWYVAFVAGFAFGQDCKYVNTINYDKAGEIINSKQEYNCETPKQIVEVHTYPNEDARNVMSSKVYGIPLNAYENPEQVLYNMQEDLKQARNDAAFNAQVNEGVIKSMFYLLSFIGN